jgi:tubulin---tyrosine ligase
MHNHFECNYFLGNKKALFYSLKKYYSLQKQNPFQFIPLTFHIAEGLNDP